MNEKLELFRKEVQSYDFQVKEDLDANLDGDPIGTCFYLRTEPDLAAGIHEAVLSPFFSSEQELADFWFDNSERIIGDAFFEADYETNVAPITRKDLGIIEY